MRAKSLILLVIALGCGMIAAVGVSKAIMDKNPTAQAVEDTLEIFVAVKDLPHAQKISADSVKLEKWPRSRLPEGALTKLDELEGKYTNQMIFIGEPILGRKLADSRESFSTAIPPGYRVFDIPGSHGYIKPGDHVDILGTFQVGGRGGASETRTVMRNVQVFGIDGVTTRDSDLNNGGRPSVFQLLVKESQLEALTLANSMSELRMNLRPFGEDSVNEADNGESFMRWLNESSDAPKPAGLEVMTSIQGVLPGMENTPAAPTQQMTIISGSKVEKYEWAASTDMPKLIVDTPNSDAATPSGGWPTNQFTGTTGNVYSGYGGYTPTYPISTPPQQTAEESAPSSNTSEPNASAVN